MLSPHHLERARLRALDVAGRAVGLARWPEVPVRWNRRLRRAGRALIEGEGRQFRRAAIELSPAYFEVYPQDLDGILVHEAVHVALAIQGRPCGHGPDFRQACVEAGGLLHGRALPGRLYRYRCPTCGALVDRRRPASRDRYCARCVEAARREGRGDPFDPRRALVLVGVRFAAPESVDG